MKQIAHRVHENGPGTAPCHGEAQRMGVTSHTEAVTVVWLAHRLKPPGHPLGIAVSAAGTDLRAAGNRVPGRPRPFDLRNLRHSYQSIRTTPTDPCCIFSFAPRTVLQARYG
jgi:hypothetical protein